MNISGTLNRIGKDYTVTRRDAGSYTNGVWAPGASSTLPIRASVQPLTGDEIARLPEGQRDTARYKLFTVTPLHTAKTSAFLMADQISLFGDTFEVESVENWADYYRAVVVKVSGGPG